MFAVRIAPLVALSLLTAAAALAQPTAGQSHILQDPEDHVVLHLEPYEYHAGGSDCVQLYDRALFRVLPNGSLEPERFRVPEDRLLVVTDVEWVVDRQWVSVPLDPGASVRLTISIRGDDGTVGWATDVWMSSTATVDAFGSPVGGSQQLTAGFAVAHDSSICPRPKEYLGLSTYGAHLRELILRGYLIDAPPSS